MKNKRNVIVDILKGLAIITVILVHVFRGKGSIDILIGEIGRWSVPGFFMIQGFYMNRTIRQPWLKYSFKKIKNIYLPFIVFSIIYGWYFFIVDSKEFTFSNVILGETAVHLYFVIHYMFFALLFPFLYRVGDRFRSYCIWLMIFSNFILCLILELQKAHGFRLITYSGINPAKWWGFIALGMLLAERQRIFDYIKEYRILVMVASGLTAMIGILLPFWTNTVGYMYNRSSLFPLAIGITVLIITIFQQWEIPGKDILAYIGKRSFGIYLIHFLIIHFLKYVIGLKEMWLVTILTIMICLLTLKFRKIYLFLVHLTILNGKKKSLVDY